jgi:hypothetical protein
MVPDLQQDRLIAAIAAFPVGALRQRGIHPGAVGGLRTGEAEQAGS